MPKTTSNRFILSYWREPSRVWRAPLFPGFLPIVTIALSISMHQHYYLSWHYPRRRYQGSHNGRNAQSNRRRNGRKSWRMKRRGMHELLMINALLMVSEEVNFVSDPLDRSFLINQFSSRLKPRLRWVYIKRLLVNQINRSRVQNRPCELNFNQAKINLFVRLMVSR